MLQCLCGRSLRSSHSPSGEQAPLPSPHAPEAPGLALLPAPSPSYSARPVAAGRRFPAGRGVARRRFRLGVLVSFLHFDPRPSVEQSPSADPHPGPL